MTTFRACLLALGLAGLAPSPVVAQARVPPVPSVIEPTRVTLLAHPCRRKTCVPRKYTFVAEFTAAGPNRIDVSASLLLLGRRGHYWGQNGDPPCQNRIEHAGRGQPCRGATFLATRDIGWDGPHREPLSEWALLRWQWTTVDGQSRTRTELVQPCILPTATAPPTACAPLVLR